MDSIETTQDLAQLLRKLFRMWPAFNLGEGLIQLSSAFWEREALAESSRPFDWQVAGLPLLLLYGLSVPYFAVVLLFEGACDGGIIGVFRHWTMITCENLVLRWYGVRERAGALFLDDGLADNMLNRDEDVEQELHLIVENYEEMKHSAPVLFRNVWKIYLPPSSGLFGLFLAPIFRSLGIFGRCFCYALCAKEVPASVRQEEKHALLPKRAVRGMSVAVRQGETFVLLGINGSGKSTCVGMLTGDTLPTAGSLVVTGIDISGNNPRGIVEARKNVGLCPQVDPLLEGMTGRETLTMFARVRGVPKDSVAVEVQYLLELLTLTPHADKTTETYSGGSKRKLSLGIALIGNPKVLVIDEACSGIDASAQRKIWNLIAQAAICRSVVLTTHSMDEAQALSSKTAIMTDGKLLCLGSVQHLKVNESL